MTAFPADAQVAVQQDGTKRQMAFQLRGLLVKSQTNTNVSRQKSTKEPWRGSSIGRRFSQCIGHAGRIILVARKNNL